MWWYSEMWWKYKLVQPLWRVIHQYLVKLKMLIFYDSEILLPSIQPRVSGPKKISARIYFAMCFPHFFIFKHLKYLVARRVQWIFVYPLSIVSMLPRLLYLSVCKFTLFSSESFESKLHLILKYFSMHILQQGILLHDHITMIILKTF